MNRFEWRRIGPGIALVVLAVFQPWLEQRMFIHMVVELPLIFAIGWWTATSSETEGPGWLHRINAGGLSGLTAAMAISACWMLPLSLDAAVLHPFVGWLKVASVLLAGWLTQLSLRQARPAVQAFFVLNWAWMTGAAGVLYQQAPERLCSTYLQGDQAWAGIGLVVMAVCITAAWMLTAFRDSSELPAVSASD